MKETKLVVCKMKSQTIDTGSGKQAVEGEVVTGIIRTDKLLNDDDIYLRGASFCNGELIGLVNLTKKEFLNNTEKWNEVTI